MLNNLYCTGIIICLSKIVQIYQSYVKLTTGHIQVKNIYKFNKKI